MHIVFFNHPPFLGSQSMPRFADLLANGMKEKGHQVESWTPKAFFYRAPVPGTLKKWMGYIDQYILFPAQVKAKLKKYPADTLFVFTDHALGPWVPLVAKKPHVIHCHDFLAQQSALGQIKENPVTKTGKLYQKFIYNGYSKGKNFISVSEKTRSDLHTILGYHPQLSEVIYNGLSQQFKPTNDATGDVLINKEDNIDTGNGYILHIGGNQWYKNRIGVIEIYNAWRKKYDNVMPLVMIGAKPNEKILTEYNNSPVRNDIHFLTGKSDAYVRNAFAHATVFLFPSLAEGFGWPIAEAMASGCPVVTTNEAPMTEVAGGVAFFINRRPANTKHVADWANNSADVVNNATTLTISERQSVVNDGIENSKRFNTNLMLEKVEGIYTGLTERLNRTQII